MTLTRRPATFLQTLDRTSSADLAVLVVGRPDAGSRELLLQRFRAAAAEAPDRTAMIERTRLDVAELMCVRLNRAGLVVTWAGLPWAGASPLRAEDRVWLSLAAQDAAVADLLADRLSPDDRDQLRGPWDVAASMPGLGYDGTPAIRGPLGIAAVLALIIAVFVTGAFPFLVVLAAQRRRRSPDEHV